MGKLRAHIAREDHALAEWIARKLRNHDPATVREAGQPKKKQAARERIRHEEGTSQVVYCAMGQNFLIEVQLIDEDQIPVAVG